MSTTRICPRCGGHFDVANWICPHCGAEFAPPRPMSPGWLQKLAPYPGALTKGVIGVTAAVFLVQAALSGSIWNMNGQVLYDMGAMARAPIDRGEVWRLVTPILLHGGVLHILFNMFALFQLGPLVEQTFGRGRFLVLYLLAGIAASLASYWFSSAGMSVGASGAVCGFLGVMAAWGKRRGGVLGAVIKRTMIRWAIFILIFGLLMPRIDNAAHAGGFVAGLALAFVFSPKGFKPETAQRRWLWSAAAAAAILVVGLCAVAAAMNVVSMRRIEEQTPQIRKLGRRLGGAWLRLQQTYDPRHVPEAPDPIPEGVLTSARNVLRAEDEALAGGAHSLGEGAQRAVDDTRRALRLRIQELEARIAARPPPDEKAIDVFRRAMKAWDAYKKSVGLL